MRGRFLATLGLLLAVGAGACGEESQPPSAQSRLAAALGTVSDAEPIGTGYGWIDVERLRQGERPLAADLEWAAGALGPGARDIAGDSRAIATTGIAPLEADALISTVTSYTLALRLDGVDAERAEELFVAGGARRGREDGWTTLDFGAEWSVPDDPRLAPLGSLAARSAVRPGTILLARSPLARQNMMRTDSPAIDAAEVSAAVSCLGDVVAARLVLNNHTHLPNSGPDLLAFGVVAGSEDPPREVLCAVGGPDERVDTATRSLETAFEPEARDEVSGEQMSELVSSAEVDTYDDAGLPVARARLVLAPGTEPGHLFGAFDRGSLLTYIGLQPPPSPGSG